MTNNTKNSKLLLRSAVLIFFAVVLIIGFFIYDDYSDFGDDAAQRTHTLVTYQYLNQKLFGRTVVEIQAMGLPDLDGYISKQYGVALQLPLVFVEDLTDFAMPTRDIYLMRHLYNFLIFFIALIAFFFMIKNLLKSEWLALTGTAMMYLFPLFFASAYINIKDLMFVSMFIITCFFMVRMLTRKRKIIYCLLFAATAALCSGVRILGIILPLALTALMLTEDIIKWRSKNTEIKAALDLVQSKNWIGRLIPYIIVLLGTVLFYIVFMPASWADPAGFFTMTAGKAIEYDMWNGTTPFAGENLTWDQMPWYYLPVYMGITIPIYYLIMFFIGIGFLASSLVKTGRLILFIKNRYRWMMFGLFLAPFLFQILAHVKIYLGWRHMFMLFVPLCVLAVYGIQQAHERLKGSKGRALRFIMPAITIAALAVGAVRIVKDHPYQLAMFNAIGIPVADQYYRNGRIAGVQCLEYVLQKYPDRVLSVNSNQGSIMLTDEQKRNILVLQNTENTDFIVAFYIYTIGNQTNIPGYKEIYSISIDGYKIASILKHWSFDMQAITEIPLDTLNVVGDDSTTCGIQTTGKEPFLVDEPNITLQPGNYVITYDLSIQDSDTDPLGFADILKNDGIGLIASEPISKSDFTGEQQKFQFKFTIDQETKVHLRLYFYPGARVGLNKATIEKTSDGIGIQ